MRKIFTFLVVLLFAVSTQGQISFEKTYGGAQDDKGTSIVQTSDGGYIMAGKTSSFGTGVYVVRTNSMGDEIWSKTYLNMPGEMQPSIVQLSNNSIIVINDNDNGSCILTSVDFANGDTLWTKVVSGIDYIGGTFRIAATATNDGGFAITSFNLGLAVKVFITKYDASGNQLWYKEYAPVGSSITIGSSITQTSDNGFLVVGISASSGSGNIYCFKTDASGDSLWTRVYDGGSDDIGWYGKETDDGGFIIVGGKAGGVTGAIGYDYWLIKTDINGDTLWTRTYGGNKQDEAWCVEVLSDGYLISGETQSFGEGGTDVWLVRTNNTGDTLWTKTYGGDQDECGRICKKTTDNGFIIAGFTKSFGAGGADFYLLKTNSSGQIVGVPTIVNNNTNLKIYPNPIDESSTLYIDLNESSISKRLIVTDLIGKVVNVIDDFNDNKIAISKLGLKSGAYIIEIHADRVYKTKLIVN